MAGDAGDAGYIPFHVTEDDEEFEAQGGFYGGLGSGRHQKKRKMTKEEAIYGVFGDYSDDDDDGDADMGDSGKHTKGVSFVASSSSKPSDSDAPSKTAAGDDETAATDDSDADMDERPSFVKSFGHQPRRAQPSMAPPTPAAPSPRPRTNVSQDFGSFEQSSKGFGMKMLRKMGFQVGQGLGREGQGIVEPVQVKQRPTGAGIAFGDFDERTTQAKQRDKSIQRQRGKPGDDSDDSAPDTAPDATTDKPRASWRSRAKKQVVFKTVEELIAEHAAAAAAAAANQASSRASPAPGRVSQIVDMTGKETRVVDPLGAMRAQSAALADPHMQFPELRHNLRLVADMSQHEMTALERNLAMERDRVQAAKQTVEQLEVSVAEEALQIGRLEQVMSLISSLPPRPSPPDFSSLFSRLHTQFPLEYASLNLSSLAVAVAAPLLRTLLATWHPLEDPTRDLATVSAWRALLVDDNSKRRGAKNDIFSTENDIFSTQNDTFSTKTGHSSHTMSPYETLMYVIWLPRVRSALHNEWHPRSPAAAVALLSNWSPLLPPFLLFHICDQIILPRLSSEVATWDPRRPADLAPDHQLHAWILPWLPLIGQSHLSPLFAPIRYKLSVILDAWSPPDATGLAVLLPWAGVLPADHMAVLVGRVVVPKLVLALRDFVIDPSEQRGLDVFMAVMEWGQVVPADAFVHMWTQEFFSKWLAVLEAWLGGAERPNYEEITRWYIGWKEMFPEALRNVPAITNAFNMGLDMMNRSMEK